MREWLKNLVCTGAAEIGGEIRQMVAHGAHELGAAIFNGNAFVMYPRGSKDDPQIENVDHEAQLQNDQPQLEREM